MAVFGIGAVYLCVSGKEDHLKQTYMVTVNDKFPQIEAQTLQQTKIVFPDSLLGTISLLAIAFLPQAQRLINTWATYIINKHPDINYFEIPIADVPFKSFSEFIDNEMRKNVPKALHSKTATYYGSLCKEYQRLFGVNDLTTCYIYLLDKDGKIACRMLGEFTEEAKFEFEKILYKIQK